MSKMKINAFLFLVLICFQINYAQKQVKIMQPEVEFDIKQATDMLNDGASTINGIAYYEDRAPVGIKVGDTWYARVGTKVFLYPLTAYIKEYLQLKKKNKEGKRLATISPLANCYRIESKVYSQKGEFVFTGLKQGKYYLETIISENMRTYEVSGIVEIKTDKEVVEFKLTHIY